MSVPVTKASSKKRVVLLGATGSIGQNALRVIAAHRDKLELVAIAAARNAWKRSRASPAISAMRHVALFDDAAYTRGPRAKPGFPAGTQLLARRAAASWSSRSCPRRITSCSSPSSAPPVTCSPALAALAAKKTSPSPARKSSSSPASSSVAAAWASGSRLLPVDSEHNAVFQCRGPGARPPAVSPVGPTWPAYTSPRAAAPSATCTAGALCARHRRRRAQASQLVDGAENHR